ncbi:BA75_02148T0 [Komagataella pastoris]|uniref:BA75_02148T0 n=1 Tax=Komagataella pastoris TaxID=4922 RepID=A0A1B2JDZ7_PICPA|nr:BA75_02148T0 [Komagataella pastoris]
MTPQKRQLDEESNETKIDLGKKKQVTVRNFKGVKLVDIREFYTTSDGELRPGKKGISLTEETWKTLVDNIGKIQSALDLLDGEKTGEDDSKKKTKVKGNSIVTSEDDAEIEAQIKQETEEKQ